METVLAKGNFKRCTNSSIYGKNVNPSMGDNYVELFLMVKRAVKILEHWTQREATP